MVLCNRVLYYWCHCVHGPFKYFLYRATNDGRFRNGQKQFGLLASFFSLGYALMQVPSGMLAENLGQENDYDSIIMVECFYYFTGMIKHHGLLYFVRFLFGVGEAPMYPSNAVLTRHGSLKQKRSCFKCIACRFLFWPCARTHCNDSHC